MNKRGQSGSWMSESVGKIILAVLGILVLVLLAVNLGSIFFQKSKLEQAKFTLSDISRTIESLDIGDEKTYLVESPKDWYLVSYNYEEGKNRPASCGDFEGCLCICGKAKIDEELVLQVTNQKDYFYSQKGISLCQETVCKTFERKVFVDRTLDFLKDPTMFNICPTETVQQKVNFIQLVQVPILLNLIDGGCGVYIKNEEE